MREQRSDEMSAIASIPGTILVASSLFAQVRVRFGDALAAFSLYPVSRFVRTIEQTAAGW